MMMDVTTHLERKNNHRHVVFLDLDGTLCVSGQHPSLKTIYAMSRAQANGHKMVLCTGRSMAIIPQDILDLKWDGIISGIGAHIQVGDSVIQDIPYDRNEVYRLVEVLRTMNVIFIVETNKNAYIPLGMFRSLEASMEQGINHELTDFIELVHRGDVLDWSLYNNDPVYNVAFLCVNDIRLRNLQERLGANYRVAVHPAETPETLTDIELVRSDVNKGTALRRMCKHLGMSTENSIAFGDSMNDREMLQSSGYGVAMGNGDSEIKAYADMICDNVENDGLYYAFESLGLI